MIPDTMTLVKTAHGNMTVPICALLDGKLRARLAEIIATRGITTVVETGIDRGGSTMLFSEMVHHVIGIDNDRGKVDIVKTSLRERGIENVTLVCLNSPDALREEFEGGLDASQTLFLLDAHWQAYWPLKDEIRAIPRGKGVLVMHDARVPGCPDLGVDEYNGQELSYEYLQDVLTEWSPTHRVEYNDNTAEFPRRGVMFVYPS
jgi:predicted O-methyltransferase YrrM